MLFYIAVRHLPAIDFDSVRKRSPAPGSHRFRATDVMNQAMFDQLGIRLTSATGEAYSITGSA